MFDFSVYLEIAKQLAIQYGPGGWSILKNIYRVEALSYILPGLFLFLSSFVALQVYRKAMKERKALRQPKTVEEQDSKDAYGIVALVSAGFGICSFIFSILILSSVWTWVELFYPDLYIAKILLNSILHGR